MRPSELLIGDKVGHNFKHIMSDFSELQRRVLKRVLTAGEKKERVVKYHSKLQVPVLLSLQELTKMAW